jgi:pimeloyl-ACP methyl ester carboxylesterase
MEGQDFSKRSSAHEHQWRSYAAWGFPVAADKEVTMPEITANGVKLAYEVFGKGQPVVWSTEGWDPRNSLAYLVAGRLSAHYRVLLWDRRNSGASEVAMVDTPSEHDLWTEDLHCLLAALDMSPAYVAGACNGAALSLRAARRYPHDVRGLILLAPPCHYTAATADTSYILDGHFHSLVKMADESGMEAVIAGSTDAWVRLGSASSEPRDWQLSWVAQTIAMNPDNRERLLAMNPKTFAAIMRRWAGWYGQGPGHVHGIPYEDIRPITLPALVAHGFDPVHPRDTAEELYQLLPNAQWVGYSDRYAQEEMDQAGMGWGLALPFMEEFLHRMEGQ